jgi:hypothetical protein
LSIVLAYHGCDVMTAQKLLGGSSFQLSNRDWDWLGSGAYFWEWDIVRAYEWARESRGISPSIVGAAIELGNCLDLTTLRGTRAVRAAYDSYRSLQLKRGEPLPQNKDVKGRKPGDLALRFLDKAVITHLHENLKEAGVPDYDTIRALFPEGQELYPGAGFREKTHVQIAVRTLSQIRGVFRVPQYELEEFEIPGSIYDFPNMAS